MGKSLNGRQLGEGITQRKDGRYVGRFTNRFGKRESVYGNTIIDVKVALQKAQEEDSDLLNVVSRNITLNEWYTKCITLFKKHCRDTTLRTYDVIYQKIKPYLGRMKLSEINALQVQDALNRLKSDKSRKDCKALLTDIFKFAISSDLLVKNPTLKVITKIDGTEPKERVVLSDEQVKLFLERTKATSRNTNQIVTVALYTGMRCGEILGLCWDCVDFEEKTISVRRTLAYLPNDGINAIYELHDPKTKSGIRKIPMLPMVEKVLRERYERYLDESNLSNKNNKMDLVFTSVTGNPLHERNIRTSIGYWIKVINKEAGKEVLPYFTMHNLRHTFATNCIQKGMSPKALQKLLGHKDLTTTMNLYCHVREEYMTSELMKILE